MNLIHLVERRHLVAAFMLLNCFVVGWPAYGVPVVEPPDPGNYLDIVGGPRRDDPEWDPMDRFGYTLRPGTPLNEAGMAIGSVNFGLSSSIALRRPTTVDGATATITELGHLGLGPLDHPRAQPRAINDAGTIVGYAEKIENGISQGTRPVRWDPGSTTPVELASYELNLEGLPAGGIANSVNNLGVVVGEIATYPDGDYLGVPALWNSAGTEVIRLGQIAGSPASGAYGAAYMINDAGTSVGFMDKFVAGEWKGHRAVRWNSRNNATELGHLGTDANGRNSTQAIAINQAGTAIGEAGLWIDGDLKGERGVRWEANTTVATELKPPSTTETGFGSSTALAINAHGFVVGTFQKYEDGVRLGTFPVRWDAGSSEGVELENLGIGTVPRAGYSTRGAAEDINDAGIAVGWAWKFDDAGDYMGPRAVLWGMDGVAIELSDYLAPDSGWVSLATASSITNSGWVLGEGAYDPDGDGPAEPFGRFYLMNINGILPVPEPGSMGLVALGLLMVAFTRFRGRLTSQTAS